MKLFIANATAQNFQFHYRVPETKSATAVNGYIHQTIPMGDQVEIGVPDLNQMQIDSLIAQGAKYGMVSVHEMDRIGKSFKGLCYSIDKPVKSDKIERLFHHNTNVLTVVGQEFRKNAAIAENSRLLADNQKYDLPNIRKIEMSVQEENGEMSEGWRTEIDTGTQRPRPSRRRA